jgi:sphingolipid 4-desaturase/C4-monooxygenase
MTHHGNRKRLAVRPVRASRVVVTSMRFTESRDGDPHLRRRREIIRKYPEVRRLFGYEPKTAWIIAGIVVAQLAIASALSSAGGLLSSWWVILLASYFVGSVLNHWCAMGIHECSHNLAARTPFLNRCVAIMANIPILIPSAMAFCRWHQDHHTYIGIEGRDNDLPSMFEVRWATNSAFRKALWLLLYPFFAMFARGFVNRPNRWESVNIAVMIVVAIGIQATMGWPAIAYLLLSTIFTFGLNPVGGHYVHEHYLFERDQETYSYYGPINSVSFNVGYHNEHHDFFGIPGSRLPELKRMAPEYYDNLKSHRSWIGVLLDFITNERLGHFSRITRTWRTYEVASGRKPGDRQPIEATESIES